MGADDVGGVAGYAGGGGADDEGAASYGSPTDLVGDEGADGDDADGGEAAEGADAEPLQRSRAKMEWPAMPRKPTERKKERGGSGS